MPRPTKCRRVCQLPHNREFLPADGASAQAVVLTVDEYEAIRLIDHEGLSQEECSEWMQVARTTVQRIYESARKKLALVLVQGLPLRIQGGDFQLCDGRAAGCGVHRCVKKQGISPEFIAKGDDVMRIAVTYQDGQVFQHFGHTRQFKLYDVQNGAVVSASVIDTNGSGHGALAGLLDALQVDALICGGIGGGAQMALASAGIRLYAGVSGSADAAAQALAAGTLQFDPNAHCDHHDHHHGEGHTCGDHGCGEHDCHH